MYLQVFCLDTIIILVITNQVLRLATPETDLLGIFKVLQSVRASSLLHKLP